MSEQDRPCFRLWHSLNGLTHRPCRVMFQRSVASWVDRRAAEVTLSRKGAKSRTGGRKLRSTGTKARTREDPMRNPPADLEQQLESCRHELTEAQKHLAEALEQQTATNEILGIVARSPTDVQSVLGAVCQSAARLCEAYDAAIWRPDGDRLLLVAHHGPITQVESVPLVRESVVGRSVLDKQTVHIADIQSRADEFPVTSEYARRLGFRTGLCVPLMRQGMAIGAFALRRKEVQLFTERQVTLLQTFADQAVIAIENIRLLNELREQLQQQTATADVLKIISRSTFDTQPVFETIVKNAAQLCQSVLSAVYRSDGNLVHLVAHDQFSPKSVAAVQAAYPVPITSSNLIAVAVRERRVVHHPDVLVSGGYSELQRASGYRSILVVPMLRDDVAIGAIAVMQIEPRLFPETQVALLKTFADQAVIAIENVRLFDELRKRTDDLSESLQQQTATADVLKVISRSTFDLRTVLAALVESAAKLCEADIANIARPRGNGFFRVEATHGVSTEFQDLVERTPYQAGRGSVIGRVLVERTPIHILDAEADVR
jgi:two-component system, NtrC family, sensor kinase